MEYSLSFERKAHYLHVRVRGENSPAAVRGYLDEVVKICRESGCADVLLEEDLAGPRLDSFEIFSIIREKAGAAARHLRRIAYVDANEETGPGMIHFAEAQAVNRGVNMRAFVSVAEAEDWMMQQDVPVPGAARKFPLPTGRGNR